MAARIYAGRTLFLGGKGHLWIVVTEPAGIPPQVIIVNFTTLRSGVDRTVVMVRGEHAFIRHDTTVAYADARLASVATLMSLIEGGIGSFHDDCSEALLQRIRDGLLDSPLTPRWIKGFCQAQF